VKHSISNCNYC